MSQAGQPKKLWRTFQSILGTDQSGKSPRAVISAQKFLDFYSKKLRLFVGRLGGAAQSMLPNADVSFDAFERCTTDNVKRIIMSVPSSPAPSIRRQLPS